VEEEEEVEEAEGEQDGEVVEAEEAAVVQAVLHHRLHREAINQDSGVVPAWEVPLAICLVVADMEAMEDTHMHSHGTTVAGTTVVETVALVGEAARPLSQGQLQQQ
jgi:hypothetical protein